MLSTIGIGCLFGIWFIINVIIYWFSTLCWKDVICEDLRFEYMMMDIKGVYKFSEFYFDDGWNLYLVVK